MKSFIALALLLVTATTGINAQLCPTGFQDADRLGASCYQLVTAGVDSNFEDAKTACTNAGHNLAEITSPEEDAHIQNLVDAAVNGDYYIGYDSQPTGGLYRLTSSRAISPYSDFSGSAPPANSFCVRLTSGGTFFAETDCTAVHNYVCEANLAAVSCGGPNNDIVFSVNADLLQSFNADPTDLHIGADASDSNCQVSLSGGVLSATITPGECGTQVSYDVANPDAIVLVNSLYHTPTQDGITRSRGELVRYECRVQTVDLISSGAIDPQALTAQLTRVGFGEFDVSIQFTDANFQNPSNTLAATLAENVYVLISVTSPIQNDLDILVQECFATPNADRAALPPPNPLPVIANDCPGSPLAEVTLETASSLHEFRFRFSAFEFVQSGASLPFVYLHCQTRLCLSSVAGHDCGPRSCTTGRRRREAELVSRWRRQEPTSSFLPGQTPAPQEVTVGPIRLLDVPTPAPTSYSGQATTSPTFYGLMMSLGMLYLVV